MEAIERTTTDETQAATRKLYAVFWTYSQQKTTVPAKVAISGSLLHLTETLERNLSKNPLATYLAVLADLSQAQIVLAFSRAATECKHFPVPALLRDFASIGEPVAMEANESSDGSRALRCGFWAGMATQRTTTRRLLRR